MPTILSFLSGRQITNDSGVPQAGAKLYHYREGTTTALTVWQDDGASSAHAQPVVCDAGGFVPLIYVDDTFDWKVLVTTAADVTLKTYDNLPKAALDASATGFAPPLLTWIARTSAASPVALAVADAGNAYEADTTGGNIEFDLPSAASVGNGKGFVFKKTAAANSLVIDPSGSETIDDSATSITITRQYETIGIFSNGAEWYVAFRYLDDIVAGRLPTLAATQAEQEAASSTSVFATPGRQHFHPGHPKLWGRASVSGAVPALDESYNITSITDTATGVLTVTIATDFSNTTYAVVATLETGNGVGDDRFAAVRNATKAAGSFVLTSPLSSLQDPNAWAWTAIGDQA